MTQRLNEEKIKRFLADEAMSHAVYTVLLETYLEERSKLDVHEQAAERIAINLLRKGWQKLEKFKSPSREGTPQAPQPGL